MGLLTSEKTDKPEPDIRTGRIDITLFEKTPNPTDGRSVALIEVKKYAQKFICSDDIYRLKGLVIF